jgi:hypothetical protein
MLFISLLLFLDTQIVCLFSRFLFHGVVNFLLPDPSPLFLRRKTGCHDRDNPGFLIIVPFHDTTEVGAFGIKEMQMIPFIFIYGDFLFFRS